MNASATVSPIIVPRRYWLPEVSAEKYLRTDQRPVLSSGRAC